MAGDPSRWLIFWNDYKNANYHLDTYNGSTHNQSSYVNDVIADKNVVTEIMNDSTGLQHIELNGFAKRYWQTGYSPVAYGWCLGLFWGLGVYLLFNGLGY